LAQWHLATKLTISQNYNKSQNITSKGNWVIYIFNVLSNTIALKFTNIHINDTNYDDRHVISTYNEQCFRIAVSFTVKRYRIGEISNSYAKTAQIRFLAAPLQTGQKVFFDDWQQIWIQNIRTSHHRKQTVN